jgi:hypothetical protein
MEDSMPPRNGRGWFATSLIVAMICSASARAVEPIERISEQEARRLVAEVLPRVEELRGLSFKEAVPVEVVDDAAVREHVLARLRAFDQDRHLENVQRAYELLGLIPDGADIVNLLLDALEEQAGGYYDPSRGAYYLLDDMPLSSAPILTAHELTHALEDQHFDLDKRLREVLADDDRMLARSAVHEGSATILMSTYAMGAVLRGELDIDALQSLAETEAGRAAKLRSLPDVLLRQILGPYVLGALFLSGGNLMGIVQGFPEDAVNRAMAEGPVSTEQLLHPDKYWDDRLRDEPSEVELAGVGRLLGRRWKLAGRGVFGELTLGALVGAETPLDPGVGGLPNAAAWTNAAAAGWDGDRWELWEAGGRSVVLLLTDWDSSVDASEFAAALPERERLDWQADDRRVAVVAGDAGKKTRRLLARMLR